MLDNLIPSVKIALRHKERNFRFEIVPNPFGGVNTYLWSNESYLVGIVPQSAFLYSHEIGGTSERILRLSGVVSGKNKIKMSFPRNLIRYWR
jgi:hypothetical protein